MRTCMDKTVKICHRGIFSSTKHIDDHLVHRHANHHDHSDNIDLADLVLDTEHMLDDLDIYTERELESMNVDEKVVLYIFLKLKNAFLGFHLVQCP